MAYNKQSGKYEGFIYLITNNVNGKKYVGQTRTTIEHRFAQHKSDSKKYNFPLYRSFNKYGIDSFSINELQKIEHEDKNKLIEKLNESEIFYISSFNSKIPNGYNIVDGGNSNNGETCKIKVYCFDLYGKLLKIYDSATDIDDIDISVNNVGKVCRNGTLYSKGYLWSYNNIITDAELEMVHNNLKKAKEKQIESVKKMNENNIGHPRKIYQFTLDGKFIREWSSIKEASLYISNGKCTNCLSHVLSGKTHQSHGYLWSYTKEPPKEYICKSYCRAVKQYDLNFNYIQTYNSMTEACKDLDEINVQPIMNCCKGITNQAYGYMWRYVDENDNNPNLFYEKKGYMQSVDMYDLDDNYITTYENMISISDDYRPSQIMRCCKGEIKKAYNHIWKFNNNAKKSA